MQKLSSLELKKIAGGGRRQMSVSVPKILVLELR